jgi:hypothetical protein
MVERVFAPLIIGIAATAGLAKVPVARAQDSDDVTVEIRECVELKIPEERRACYGARVDAAVQERERSATPADASERPASAPDARTDSPRRTTTDTPADSPDIVAKIAGLRETVPNSYLITLDNGQVWRQIRPKWVPLRIGHEVRIYSTTWGAAFRLSIEGLSGYLQVERVR